MPKVFKSKIVELPDPKRAEAFFTELQAFAHERGYALLSVQWVAERNSIPRFQLEILEAFPLGASEP